MLHSRAYERRTHTRGQAVVEFALILPVLLALAGLVLDLSRVYQAWITLHAATRDAAEYVATTQTVHADAETAARDVVCLATKDVVGFTRATGATSDANCTAPSVSLDTFTYSTDPTIGGSDRYPLVTARVSSALNFRPLIPYPFLTSAGTLTVRVEQAFQIVQNRE
jgi:Flp pilus assembly protein TadG